MESTLTNAGVKLKKIEDEYRRRMEEEINKNKEIVAQVNQLNAEMDNKGNKKKKTLLTWEILEIDEVLRGWSLVSCGKRLF